MSTGRGGGGAATQSGTNYQNRVAAWFAVSILAEEAVSPPWNLPANVTLKFLRCETEQPVDDILIGNSSSGHAFIQAKHSLSLKTAPESELGKTINQFVRQFFAYRESRGNRLWERPLDAARDRLVLVTSLASPNSVTKDLYWALEKFRHQFSESETSLNQGETKAFDIIKNHIVAAWQSFKGCTPTDTELQDILRLIYVQILDIDSGKNDEISAKDRLRTGIIEDPAQSDLAWGALINICTQFAVSRSGGDRTTLQNLLYRECISLKPVRSYQADIEKLREYSYATVAALSELSKIEIGTQFVKINRQVTRTLRMAANQESLLVVGDPGSGKSGTIHDFVGELLDENYDVIFLAVDRFDVNSSRDLQNELGLEHRLEDVLNNWQNSKPGWLVIDALDAARSEKSVKVFRDVIASIIKSTSRWKVVASIRKFDLRYSLELQQLFQGNSNIPENFCDTDFLRIRHINVPKLTQEELNQIKEKSEVLAEFIDHASEKLQELLTIPFNLRLIADLLGINISVESLTPIQTQIELLDRFWQVRVITSDYACGDARETLLQQVVEKMVATRTLRVNRSEVISNTASSGDASQFLTQILSSHILAEWKPSQNARFERSILTFSHHVLFDYAVSRLFLRGLPQPTVERLETDLDLVLAIRPSLVFHFQHLWFLDPNRGEFWEFVFKIIQSNTIPEIGKLVGLSVAADLITNIADCEPLFEILETNRPLAEKNAVYQAFSHLVGAILVDFTISLKPLVGLEASPWCEIIERCSHLLKSNNLQLFFAVRSLVWNICKQAENLNSSQLDLAGIAARSFFDFAWQQDLSRQRFIGRELQAVCHTFKSDPFQSAEMIQRCLEPDAMRIYGFQSIFWLADEIGNLIPYDPKLVADIYRIAFSYNEESEAQTVLGGSILPLTSTRRQDFESDLYSLGQNFSNFLEAAPIYATRTLIAVIEAYVAKSHPLRGSAYEKSFDFDNRKATIKADHSYIWDSATYSYDVPMKMLDEFSQYLEHLSEDANQLHELQTLIDVIVLENKLAIVWRCLLKCGIKYPATLGRKIRYLAWATPILTAYDTTTLVGDFIKTIFVNLISSEREKVELAIISIPNLFGEGYEESSQHMRNRLLGCLEVNTIVTQEATLILSEIMSQGGVPPNLQRFSWGEVKIQPYGERDYLVNQGVPVTAEANLRIQDLEEPVKAFSEKYLNLIPDTRAVEDIFPSLQSLHEALQTAEADDVHPEQCNYAWGVIASACDRITNDESLSCETDLGRFIKQVLLEASKQPEPIHYPEYDQQFDDSQSWGSPAARIDAAQGLTKLTYYSTCVDDELFAIVEQLTVDPVPAVRYQVTSNLLCMYKNKPQLMWSIISRISHEEQSRGVLQGLLSTLGRLSGSHGETITPLIKAIFDRITDGNGSKQIRENCTSIFVGIDVWQDNPIAREVISQIISHPDEFHIEASRIVTDIRDYLTLGSIEPVNILEEKARKRAFDIISQILNSSSTILFELRKRHPNALFEQWLEQDQEKFKRLAQLGNSIAMQIYFASGAFEEKRNGLSQSSKNPLSLQVKHRFLNEASPILDKLSAFSFPSLVHRLLETLTFFVDINPEEIFLRVGHVVKTGREGAYEYEFQGEDLVVKFIERFLAEYRYILRDSEECRRVLIETLDTFVQAGWLSARRLTYRLEEIFR